MSLEIPAFPRLRAVEPQWIEYQGRSYLHLQDPSGLSTQSVLVPRSLAPLLALCDGTRDVSTFQSGMRLRFGSHVSVSAIEDLLSQLDSALLLENGAFQQASAQALRAYREAEQRQLSHAGGVYPSDPAGLKLALREYCDQAATPQNPPRSPGALTGVICPHIDFERGHDTYAQLWKRAEPDLSDVELVIVFGTDHAGGLGVLTPTRQNYATPLGVLPTDQAIVDRLVDVLGSERALGEEIHHIREHSIELALVWFHYFMKGRPCPIVPILCGSFHHFVTGAGDPRDDETIVTSLDLLREASASRRTLVIAAGDLAHMGPAFGDAMPLDTVARAKLAAEDSASIAAICESDATAFLEHSRRDSDARRICGLSPIYLALELLADARGQSMGYAQCPADAEGGSVVSITGALLYKAT